MFFDMNVSNTKSKNLVLASPLKQNLNKLKNWLGAPDLIMASLIRGGVEDTKLEAKAKGTKKSEAKAKNNPSEERPSQGQGQECSRPRTKAQRRSDHQEKKVFAPKSKNSAVLETRTGHFSGLADFKAKDFKLYLRGLHFGP